MQSESVSTQSGSGGAETSPHLPPCNWQQADMLSQSVHTNMMSTPCILLPAPAIWQTWHQTVHAPMASTPCLVLSAHDNRHDTTVSRYLASTPCLVLPAPNNRQTWHHSHLALSSLHLTPDRHDTTVSTCTHSKYTLPCPSCACQQTWHHSQYTHGKYTLPCPLCACQQTDMTPQSGRTWQVHLVSSSLWQLMTVRCLTLTWKQTNHLHQAQTHCRNPNL